jgi:TonB family protein
MIVTILRNALWEGGLIVALAALTLRFVPHRNATTRYAVWFLALAALVAVPMVSSGIFGSLHIGPVVAPAGRMARADFALTALAPLAGAARWLTWPSSLGASLALPVGAIWAVGALVMLARLAASLASIRRIRCAAAQHSHIEGVPVLTTRDLAIPIATGAWASAILVPETLVQSLSPSELRCILAHELAHVRRGDVATNAIARIVEALLFWNPWVYLVNHRLVREREAACDDFAARRIGQASYAGALAALGRRLARGPAPLLTPSAFTSRSALVLRIERLMSGRPPDDLKINYLAIGGLTMLFVALTVALQSLVPAPALALPATAGTSRLVAVAASCKDPNAAPAALNPAMPELPRAQWPSQKVSVIVEVAVLPNGKAGAVHVYRSSGDPDVDHAVLAAAKKSTYSPKLANCVPVQGNYLFRADFAGHSP